MKRVILLILALFIFNAHINAQHTSDSVKATINSLFEAMLEADGAKVKQCFTDSAVLQTITKDKAGLEVVKNDGVLDFVNQINAIPKGLADERIVFGVVKVDGPLAIVWAPYKFYKNGVFSHCGVNSFQLVRLNQQWKIQYLIDTRRKNNCAE